MVMSNMYIVIRSWPGVMAMDTSITDEQGVQALTSIVIGIYIPGQPA